MEQMFADHRGAAQASMSNNFALAEGQLQDEGYTAGASARFMMENAKRGTWFGVGADVDYYTEFQHPDVGKGTLGVHRDDEARLYALYGQQGAAVQHIVDRLRDFVPWANISILSWEAKVGATGTRNWGGLRFQDAFHRNAISGGTVEDGSIATQYPGAKRIGPYFSASGFAGSRIGGGPLSIGVRATGHVAPAGTTSMTTGLEVQLDHNDFYVRIGIAGSVQKSSLAEFDGSRQDGAYPTAFGAVGYQGDQGSGFEVRISQNPQGTGLGLSSLGSDHNLAATVMGRLTTDSIGAFLRKLCF